jgi:hypothetical protein
MKKKITTIPLLLREDKKYSPNDERRGYNEHIELKGGNIQK